MIEIRSKLGSQQNPHIFEYPGVADKWIKADVAIRKLAEVTPNINNPSSISWNELRKQISTILKILNMHKEGSEPVHEKNSQ